MITSSFHSYVRSSHNIHVFHSSSISSTGTSTGRLGIRHSAVVSCAHEQKQTIATIKRRMETVLVDHRDQLKLSQGKLSIFLSDI